MSDSYTIGITHDYLCFVIKQIVLLDISSVRLCPFVQSWFSTCVHSYEQFVWGWALNSSTILNPLIKCFYWQQMHISYLKFISINILSLLLILLWASICCLIPIICFLKNLHCPQKIFSQPNQRYKFLMHTYIYLASSSMMDIFILTLLEGHPLCFWQHQFTTRIPLYYMVYSFHFLFNSLDHVALCMSLKCYISLCSYCGG